MIWLVFWTTILGMELGPAALNGFRPWMVSSSSDVLISSYWTSVGYSA